MKGILKLETLCMEVVRKLSLVTTREEIPATVSERIMALDMIEGKYLSQDCPDIEQIILSFNGEVINFTFAIYSLQFNVTMTEGEQVPMLHNLLYSIFLEDNSLMCVNISYSSSSATIKISSGDSQWKWDMFLDIRYCVSPLIKNNLFICYSLDMIGNKCLTLTRRNCRKIEKGAGLETLQKVSRCST